MKTLKAERARVEVWRVGRDGRDGEKREEEFAEPARASNEDLTDDTAERVLLESVDVRLLGEGEEGGGEGASKGDGEVHADEGADPDRPGGGLAREGHVVVRCDGGPSGSDGEHLWRAGRERNTKRGGGKGRGKEEEEERTMPKKDRTSPLNAAPVSIVSVYRSTVKSPFLAKPRTIVSAEEQSASHL